MASDQRCGQCHEDRLDALPRHLPRQGHGAGQAERRRRTSPPATTATAITTCCRRPNPASRLSKTNILATCQQCHPGATASFTEYMPHANPLDRQELPAAPLDVRVHDRAADRRRSRSSACTPSSGSSASVYLYLHDSKTFREAKVETQSGRRVVHPLPAVRALPALPGRDQLPAAGHHRHAAEVLLHRLGQGDLRPHRRRGRSRARCTTSARSSRSSTSACTWRRLVGTSWQRPRRACATRQTGKLQSETALAGAVRAGLDGADAAGLARFRRAPEMVLRQGPAAAVRPLDLLGEVRLLRRVLGRGHHRRSPA